MAEPTIPTDVQQRLDRGRKHMRRDMPKRKLCARFTKGETYSYVTEKNILTEQSTVTNPNGSGKPPHRIRNKYNFIGPIVEAKVSAATQRVPSYEITPTSTDPTIISAASLSEQVARYGYDKWYLRDVTVKTVKLAIGHGGVGYALPYFDPNVGPYTRPEEGGPAQGTGELKVIVLSGNEAYSEPGVDFLHSPWYAIERARPLEEVKQLKGLAPDVKLTPDAESSDTTNEADSDNLVITTEYFERPSPRYPDGRCMTIANGRPIIDYRLITQDPTDEWWGPYPLMDHEGAVLDEPILHRLVYNHDPDTDQDFGLTWQLIDFERTIQDSYNKLLEWKNRCLNPQMKAVVGSLVSNPNDVPGDVRYYRPIGGKEPEWETPPPVPDSLFRIIERALQDMRDVAADQNIDLAPNLAAKTVEAGVEQNANRWQSFIADLAEWHSRLMRHCLLIVARDYSTPRLLEIRGRDGWQLIQDFRGAQLMGQSQVRVLPDSLAPLTRAGIRDQIAWINTNWPGFLNPEAAIQALQAGSLDRLTQSYWLDVGRANLVVQKIVDGTVLDMPDRTETRVITVPDPQTGMPIEQAVQEQVPSFMPNEVDNLNVWRSVFSDFLKTDTFQRLPEEMQEVGMLIWQQLEKLEDERAAKQLARQNAIAAQQGATNAAKPQVKGMPSQPGSGTVPAAA